MRKAICILSAILFILTMITGIAEASPQHAGSPVAHIFIVILFTATILAHIWINRKAVARYFSGAKAQ